MIPTGHNDTGISVQEHLCDLLLEIVGRNPGRMTTALKHVRVLDAAFDHMTEAQADIARARIRRIETKWGRVSGENEKDPETHEIAPEIRVAKWLSTRHVPYRHLALLYRAATEFWAGKTSLSAIMDRAYAPEIDMALRPPGYDSFKEWMVELRIARREAKGVYIPGSLCEWWVKEMRPDKPVTPAYARCMTELQRFRL